MGLSGCRDWGALHDLAHVEDENNPLAKRRHTVQITATQIPDRLIRRMNRRVGNRDELLRFIGEQPDASRPLLHDQQSRALVDRRSIEAQVAGAHTAKSMEAVLTEASQMLSGLTRSAGVVLTAKANARLKHIEFVRLEPERALAVLVAEDGQVENGVLNVPPGLPTSSLIEAANFLNARIRGKTLADLQAEIEKTVAEGQAELDQLTQKVIATGLASWSGGENDERQLIVRGHANLLEDLRAVEDLERVRSLFDALETKRGVIDLLGRAERADGVRIFIGSENKLFSLSGSSTIVAPYRDSKGRIVGVIGVIGPTRLNYARVIPMVDYTARVVGRLLAP